MAETVAETEVDVPQQMSGGETQTVVKRYGALEVCVVSQYSPTWDDRGSGAAMHGAYFSPNAPSGTGWRRLSHLGRNGSDQNISGQRRTVMVRQADGGTDMFAHPTDYQLLWKDQGSGADRNGSLWRPIPPAGFVALGDVVWGNTGTGWHKPPTTE